jgi:hypothetical protein
MPTKTWAVGEEVLAADFNAMVQRQIVATFPNAAARTAEITTPTAGMVSYLADTKALQVYDGAAWQTVRGLGSTGLAYSERTVPTGAVGSVAAEIVDLRIPFTTPGGRRIRVAAGGTFQQNGAPATAHLFINEDAPGVASVDQYADPPGAFIGLYASRILTPAAGTHSYSVWISTDGGTIAGMGGTNRPIWLSVEDMG